MLKTTWDEFSRLGCDANVVWLEKPGTSIFRAKYGGRRFLTKVVRSIHLPDHTMSRLRKKWYSRFPRWQKKHFKIFFTFDKSVQSSRIRTHNWKGSNTFKRNQIGQNIKLGAKYCVCTIVRFKSSPQNGTVSKFKQINFTELADPMVTLKTGDAWFESLRVRGYPEDSAVFLTPFRNTLR